MKELIHGILLFLYSQSHFTEMENINSLHVYMSIYIMDLNKISPFTCHQTVGHLNMEYHFIKRKIPRATKLIQFFELCNYADETSSSR